MCIPMPPLQTLARRDAALDRSKGKLGAGSFLFRFTFGTLEGDHLPGSTPPIQKPSQGKLNSMVKGPVSFLRHLQLPQGLNGLQRPPHAWRQRRVCGTR